MAAAVNVPRVLPVEERPLALFPLITAPLPNRAPSKTCEKLANATRDQAIPLPLQYGTSLRRYQANTQELERTVRHGAGSPRLDLHLARQVSVTSPYSVR